MCVWGHCHLVAKIPFFSSRRLTLNGFINATADGITRYVAKSVDFAVCTSVFMQTDSKVILGHVTTPTRTESHGAVETTEVEIPILHEWRKLWIIKLKANIKDRHQVSSEVFGICGALGELPMKNCSAMLCTRMWSKGITHSLPKFAASFKASTSYTRWGQVSLTHRETEQSLKRQTF